MKHTAAEGRGEENKMKTVIVDAVGEPCPIPVVKATKALRELGERERWRSGWTMRSRCRT